MPTPDELVTRISTDARTLANLIPPPVVVEPPPAPVPTPTPTPVPSPVPVPVPSPIVGRVRLDDFTTLRPQWRHYAERGPGSVAVVNGVLRETFQSGGAYLEFYSKYNGTSYEFSKGYTQAYVLDPWIKTVNRLTFRLRSPQTVNRPSDGSALFELGTYRRSHTEPDVRWAGDHFYHRLSPNLPANQWVTVIINAVPQHQVSSGSGSPGLLPHYFDDLTRWYLDEIYSTRAGSLDIDDVQFMQVDGEPDTLVASVTGCYTGSRYEVSWQTPPNSTQNYTVTANGLTATVKATGNTYTGVLWASPAMAPVAGGLRVQIQPQGATAFTEIVIP